MSTRITTGSPINRESGIGNVNPAMIRERAAELAVLDGRSEEEITDQDYDLARKELQAGLNPSAPEGGVKRTATSTDPAEPATSLGSIESGLNIEDTTQSHATRLVEEGIEEAVHDEMVESGKETLREGESRDQ